MSVINLNKHQAIVIQGPMQYYPVHVAEFYSQFDNIIWSTWDDENPNTISQVKETGINVILNKKPKLNGILNINYQFRSTFAGIEYFKENNPNITEVMKIRSDVIFFGVERALQRVNGSDISFMFMYNKHTEVHKPVYYLDYWHYGMDFPADYIVHGSIDAMHNTFNFQMEYMADIPPEAIVLRNYLKYRGLENNFDFDYLKKVGIVFFGKWAKNDDYYTLSLKNGLDLFKDTHLIGYTDPNLFLK